MRAQWARPRVHDRGHLSMGLFVAPVCVFSRAAPSTLGEPGSACQRHSLPVELAHSCETGALVRPARRVPWTAAMYAVHAP